MLSHQTSGGHYNSEWDHSRRYRSQVQEMDHILKGTFKDRRSPEDVPQGTWEPHQSVPDQSAEVEPVQQESSLQPDAVLLLQKGGAQKQRLGRHRGKHQKPGPEDQRGRNHQTHVFRKVPLPQKRLHNSVLSALKQPWHDHFDIPINWESFWVQSQKNRRWEHFMPVSSISGQGAACNYEGVVRQRWKHPNRIQSYWNILSPQIKLRFCRSKIYKSLHVQWGYFSDHNII